MLGLSLDASALHAAAVAASERYNTRFEDAVTRRLGVRFIERPDTCRSDKRPVREIAGIPEQPVALQQEDAGRALVPLVVRRQAAKEMPENLERLRDRLEAEPVQPS